VLIGEYPLLEGFEAIVLALVVVVVAWQVVARGGIRGSCRLMGRGIKYVVGKGEMFGSSIPEA
jgi:hypothetical protein